MRSTRLRLGLLGVSLVGLALWLLIAGAPSSAELKRSVNDAGWLAPAVFVTIYICWTVLLLPGVVPTLAGGALFGVIAGSLLALVGAVAGATIAFLIARRLGRASVKPLTGRRARIELWLRKHGFLALLYARLVPIVPFNVLNYAAGLTSISTREYLIATAIGIVPGTVAYAAVGSTAEHPGSIPFVVSLGAVLVLTAVLTVLSRRQRVLAGR